MLLAWLILVPLAWGTLAWVGGPRWGARLALLGLLVQGGLALALARAVAGGGVITQAVGGWGVPLGIELRVDGLSALLLVLTQVVTLPLVVYTRAWLRAHARDGGYLWPLLGLLLTALHALFVSADLFNLYVALELLGLCAVALVASGGERAQLAAAWRYLVASLVASGCFLLGVALVYATHGTVSLRLVATMLPATPALPHVLAGALMTLGLMIKTALFPFHAWLPAAHGSAAAPVSALLSALVVKASFYVLLRLRLDVYAAWAALIDWLPALLGGGAIVYGSWQALRAERLKMLIAYSTVAQLGYLFLLFPLLAVGELAFTAGTLQVFAHALAKAALFAAAGVTLLASGRDSVAGLATLAGTLPLTWFTFGLAGMSLMGLPPSGGFLAKWLLIDAAVVRGQWIMIVLVVSSGLLAAAYIFRILSCAFRTPAEETAVPPTPVPRGMEWAAFALAAASVLVGLEAGAISDLLAVGMAR
ncbi:MAG: proton-conducting transporter membrane subunit [Gammaproteobacteria bacterium]